MPTFTIPRSSLVSVIAAVRSAGTVNMFDKKGVAMVALQIGHGLESAWIEKNKGLCLPLLGGNLSSIPETVTLDLTLEEMAHYGIRDSDGIFPDTPENRAAIEEECLDPSVPQETRDEIWSLAYERGHSAGMGEVLEVFREIAPVVSRAILRGRRGNPDS